jgi:hypothetical protein
MTDPATSCKLIRILSAWAVEAELQDALAEFEKIDKDYYRFFWDFNHTLRTYDQTIEPRWKAAEARLHAAQNVWLAYRRAKQRAAEEMASDEDRAKLGIHPKNQVQ